ncbi:MAG: universal stress protein [Flavobacteriaceae bacterium]|nr:universal stress protein [Flavobacteriaceae bacterium]
MRNVLLLTDFSETSKNAMHYALRLFEHKPCNFYVVHVSGLGTHLADDFSEAARLVGSGIKTVKTDEKLKLIVQELESNFNTEHFTFKTIVKYDYLIKVINELIASENIGLIVMGSNGITGTEETLFGSNTINVIRKVTCPTLVIPEAHEYKKPGEVLVPLSEQDSLASTAFIDAKIFMKDFLKKLHLLRISNKTTSPTDKDDEHCSELLHDTDYIYNKVVNVPLHYLISTYIQLHRVDLISLIVHKETVFERLFYGSQTTKLANKNLLPLLVFHAK